jgi:hypothetical protein
MNSPLSHFKLAQYQFVLKALNPIHLPAYKGSTFRGGFACPIAFSAAFTEFAGFLLPGELIHVGKGTGFGLGKYEMLKDA